VQQSGHTRCGDGTATVEMVLQAMVRMNGTLSLRYQRYAELITDGAEAS